MSLLKNCSTCDNSRYSNLFRLHVCAAEQPFEIQLVKKTFISLFSGKPEVEVKALEPVKEYPIIDYTVLNVGCDKYVPKPPKFGTDNTPTRPGIGF